MTQSDSSTHGTVFDLGSIDSELRKEDAYLLGGHTARTLVHKADLRIVVVVMKAGAHIAEHRADRTASVHALGGHVRLRVLDKTVDLTAGQMLVMDPGVQHEVDAVAESAFLLTLGSRG